MGTLRQRLGQFAQHDLNRAAVARMLELCGGNKTEAARRLGISRPRLHRLLNSSLADTDDTDEDAPDA